MMGTRTTRLLLAAFLLLAAAPAIAIDPGSASGRFDRDGAAMTFSHSIAVRLDNAEGLLNLGQTMRVVLSDREVPPEALYGIAFTPVQAMAEDGEVRGLMLEFDPADRTELHVTILDRPDDPAESLANLTLIESEGLWTRMDSAPTRILGEYRRPDQSDMRFSFSAPVFHDRVQEDLKGADARNSAFAQLLLARDTALARGDMAAAASLSSRRGAARLAAYSPELVAAMRTSEPVETSQLTRVVVRHQMAVALMADGSWSSFVREDGDWKIAD